MKEHIFNDIQKYKIGETVYYHHNGALVEGNVIGILPYTAIYYPANNNGNLIRCNYLQYVVRDMYGNKDRKLHRQLGQSFIEAQRKYPELYAEYYINPEGKRRYKCYEAFDSDGKLVAEYYSYAK